MALRLAAVRDAGVTPPSTAPARPVRVGDMVRGRGCGDSWQTLSVEADGPCLLSTRWPTGRGRSMIWTREFVQEWGLLHADGTPIDVEASVRLARGDIEGDIRASCVDRAPRAQWTTNADMAAQAQANQQAARQQQAISQGVPFAEQDELEAARKRIAELEALVVDARKNAKLACELEIQTLQRANRLSDEAGALRTELLQVKAENSDLRRELERLERKAAKR